MAAVNPAFVPPDVGLAAGKLIDIELQALRVAGIPDPEIHVIGEIV